MMNWDVPSPKAPEIDNLLNAITGKSRIACIQSHKCTNCERPLTCTICNDVEVAKQHTDATYKHIFMPFRDRQSALEYTISGMCQRCQNEVFGIETDI